jgi:hypothetical protein
VSTNRLSEQSRRFGVPPSIKTDLYFNLLSHMTEDESQYLQVKGGCILIIIFILINPYRFERLQIADGLS